MTIIDPRNSPSEVEEAFGEGIDKRAQRLRKVVEIGGLVKIWSDKLVQCKARRVKGEEGRSVGEREDEKEEFERKTQEGVRAVG
jgi:hypothetical protein